MLLSFWVKKTPKNKTPKQTQNPHTNQMFNMFASIRNTQGQNTVSNMIESRTDYAFYPFCLCSQIDCSTYKAAWLRVSLKTET